jgi:uncharacterized protein DUF6766
MVPRENGRARTVKRPVDTRKSENRMSRFFRNNSLSLVAAALFLVTLVGQSIAGHAAYNQEQKDHAQPVVGYVEYLTSGNFAEAVFENWESEFLQMAMFIFLTAFLVQKGSAESRKPPDEEGAGEEAIDENPRDHADDPEAPWPVRRGGWVLKLYQNSLSLAFFALFLVAFLGHALSGAAEYNQEQLEHGGQTIAPLAYLGEPRFWFESFQNWQSEFLAVFSIVVFSIYLRQKGSPESKPVHKPHHETGSD